MKWLLTSTLTLVLVLGGCSASANFNTAHAMTTMNDATKSETNKVVTLKKGKGFSIPGNSFSSGNLVYTAKLLNNTSRMKKMVAYAKTFVHRTPYVFSGISPKYGWDCSGLVMWFYQKGFNINLEHSATAQGYAGHRVSKPKIGDIVVFGWKGYTGYYHASIYVGDNKVINANRGSGTTIIEPLSNYKGSRIAYVRLVKTTL